MSSALPRLFRPDDKSLPLNSRVHLALSQLDWDLSHPVLGPAILNAPKAPNVLGTFVEDLLDANAPLWAQVTGNEFCTRMAKDDLPQGLDHFRWYMVQDVLYLKNFVYWELGLFSKAPWAQIEERDIGVRIGKDVTNVKGMVDMCTDKEKLAIPVDKVTAAVPGPAIEKYIKYLQDSIKDTGEDWIGLHVVLLPCILSYNIIATNLSKIPGIDEKTKFYVNWIAPNLKVSSSVATYKDFLNKYAPPLSKERKAKLTEIFRTSCQMEIDFWKASLTGVLA